MNPFQRVIPHAGSLGRCPRCGTVSQHVTQHESHWIECRDIVSCGVSTEKHESFDKAQDEWALMGAMA